MAKLRPSFNATFYPGTGVPPEEVELQSTDMTPYMYDPNYAQMEADVTKARYGGKSIQDTAQPGAPFEKPGEQRQPARDFSNRLGFEQSVFNQIGGNPFEIDIMSELDRATNEQMPGLFQNVFGNQVIWEDRNQLDKQQSDHWNNEIKGFRAYTKQMIESDKRTKIDTYNNIMKRFDNEAKEQEAAEKKVQAKEKAWQKQVTEGKKEHTGLRKEKVGLLKRMTQLAAEGYGPGEMGATTESMTEITDVRNRLQEINQIILAPERRIATEHEGKKLAAKTGPVSKKSTEDLRADGTKKGPGYLGTQKLPKDAKGQSRVATEYSIGVKLDGKETEIPTLVPTLTKEELDLMVSDIIPNNKKVPENIFSKAMAHAKERINAGKSPFFEKGEQKKSQTKAKKGKAGRKVVRTGMYKGKKVIEYDDGAVEYAS